MKYIVGVAWKHEVNVNFTEMEESHGPSKQKIHSTEPTLVGRR